SSAGRRDDARRPPGPARARTPPPPTASRAARRSSGPGGRPAATARGRGIRRAPPRPRRSPAGIPESEVPPSSVAAYPWLGVKPEERRQLAEEIAAQAPRLESFA